MQLARRKGDLGRRDSDAQYLRDWASKNPNYWKQYRASHPDYVENNRNAQFRRNQARIAKDAPCFPFSLPAGRYQLIPVGDPVIANEDAWIVEITVLSAPSRFLGVIAK